MRRTRGRRTGQLFLHWPERVNIEAQPQLYSKQSKPSSMSRQSMAPQRNLSLTEELERLEQSITLTLQGEYTLLLPLTAI